MYKYAYKATSRILITLYDTLCTESTEPSVDIAHRSVTSPKHTIHSVSKAQAATVTFISRMSSQLVSRSARSTRYLQVGEARKGIYVKRRVE